MQDWINGKDRQHYFNGEYMNEEKILIYDIETSTPSGSPDASTDVLRYFGAYSYVHKKFYYLTDVRFIREIIKDHDVLVGFNTMQYDNQVLYNNGLEDLIQKNGDNYTFNFKVNIDMYDVFKKRAVIMKIKSGMLGDLLMSYSLDYISKTIGIVDSESGKQKDFDYSILNKESYTEEDKQTIIKYLKRDLEVTKKMYDWLENYFKSFKDFLVEKDIETKKYLTCSTAVFAYKAICKATGILEEYTSSENLEHADFGGGYVSYPAGEEFSGEIYCLDYNSLYPSIMHQCNIYSIAKPGNNYWNGNGVFQVTGKYNADTQGKVEKLLKDFYEKRLEFKKNKDAREYSVKIIINCFDKDTQCMTVNGIKDIKDCKVGDLVYSINPKTYQLEIKPIIEVTKRKYSGVMHEYKSPYYNFKITPEHKLFLEKKNNNEYSVGQFIKSKDITTGVYKIPKAIYHSSNNKQTIYIDELYRNKNNLEIYIRPHGHARTWLYKNDLKSVPHKYKQNNMMFVFNYADIKQKIKKLTNCNIYCRNKFRTKEHLIPYKYNLDDFIKLLGWYISEGSLYVCQKKQYKNTVRGQSYRISISQYKNIHEEYYNDITDCLNKLNIKYSKTNKSFTISNSIFHNIFLQFGKGSKNLYIGKLLEILNHKQLNILFKTMCAGDGKSKSHGYVTSSDKLKDDFCKLILLLNGTFSLNKYNNCWYITYNFNKNYISARQLGRTEYQYNDYIYNVMVKDNHTLLAGSNNRFNWIGQTTYGILGNEVFKNLSNTTSASDVTLLGRQWVKLARNTFRENGYTIIYTDTDSVYLLDPFSDKDRLLSVKNKIIDTIKANVPFPYEKFDMGIDDEISHIWFFKGKGVVDKDTDIEMDEDDIINKPKNLMKKNYIYLTKSGDIKVKNLGVRKKSSSALTIKIFWDYLVPKIKEEKKVIFPKSWFVQIISELLANDLGLAAKRFKVLKPESYKLDSQLQAQIARAYGPGIHFLIPNKRLGVGIGKKYCTISEFNNAGLKQSDIDLAPVWKELDYFIENKRQKTIFQF